MGESATKTVLYCSFCGKSQDGVERLIAGPAVFICNECVVLCLGIVYQHNPEGLPMQTILLVQNQQLKLRLQEMSRFISHYMGNSQEALNVLREELASIDTILAPEPSPVETSPG